MLKMLLASASGGKPYIAVSVASLMFDLSSLNPNILWWCCSTFAGRPSRIQVCYRASSGVILFTGSQSRHASRKLRKLWS